MNNNTLASSNSSVGRVNNLLTRMLDNRSSSASSSSTTSNLRCNLFGIRLDHDQLKQEMSSLLQEQLDIQRVKWSFDFENAQPVINSAKSSNIKWKKCIVKRDENNVDVIDQTENNRRFLPIDDQIELGSSVPQFYQTQRKYKLAENKNKVNQMNNNAMIVKPEAKLIVKSKDIQTAEVVKTKQTKLKFNDENSSRVVASVNTSSPSKPTGSVSASPRKPRSLKRLDSTVRIITYSENRKDTLRSATRSSSRNSNAAPISTNVRLSASVQSLPQSTKSAFGTPSSSKQSSNTTSLKQTSLLDMLKQKKRRQVNINSSSKDVNKNDSTTTTTSGHFLRSHSASTTSRS